MAWQSQTERPCFHLSLSCYASNHSVPRCTEPCEFNNTRGWQLGDDLGAAFSIIERKTNVRLMNTDFFNLQVRVTEVFAVALLLLHYYYYTITITLLLFSPLLLLYYYYCIITNGWRVHLYFLIHSHSLVTHTDIPSYSPVQRVRQWHDSMNDFYSTTHWYQYWYLIWWVERWHKPPCACLICLLIFGPEEDLYGQWGQENGFSPVWTFTCLLILDLCLAL